MAMDNLKGATRKDDVRPPPAATIAGRKGWQQAKSVVTLVQASQGFRTLRDMVGEECIIDKDCLAIKSSLGEGAYAFVYLAMLNGTTPVAVKTLKPELLQNKEDVKLFLLENAVQKKLSHPGIVQLVGLGCASHAQQDLFIVQEYCPGGSLRDLVLKQMMEPMRSLYSTEDAMRWSLNIAQALSYLHSRRPAVMHRDLKLENILLTDQQVSQATAKLADFGLAKLMWSCKAECKERQRLQSLLSRTEKNWSDEEKQRSNNVSTALERIDSAAGGLLEMSSIAAFASEGCSSLEMTGQTGSWPYMAPEVLRGEKYNEKADIFSFSMVMYNLFYRIIPSVLIAANGDPGDVALLARRVSNGYRPALNNQKVPIEINELINACWHGVPKMRPSAEEIVWKLRSLLQEQEVSKPIKEQKRGSTTAQICGCVLQ